MLAVEINSKQMKDLADAAGRAKKSLAKELAGAINQVSKKTKLQMGREIRATVAMKKDEAEKPLSIKANATPNSLQAVVTLKKTKRLGLRHFGARQSKKGVSYKISKKGGRRFIAGAFQGPRPGTINTKWKGNVFKRTSKSRNPILHVLAVSAFGVYAKNKFVGPQAKAVSTELTKQIERRIKLNVLRANGLVST